MSNTPVYSFLEWAGPQASPWVGHDQALRAIEALIRGSVLDRDLTAPPGSEADGDAYLVGASATGDWAGKDGKMAVAVGAAAANGWLFLDVAQDGALLWVEDEAVLLQYTSSAWSALSTGGGGTAATVTESGTAADLASANNGKYQRWTNTSSKTLTVEPEATAAQPADGEWHIRNAASSSLTIAAGAGVTINAPAGGSLIVPEGGTVTLKRVAEDEFDLFGLTSAP